MVTLSNNELINKVASNFSTSDDWVKLKSNAQNR